MACSHLFQIVPIQIIYGLSECKNLVEVVPLLLDKSNNLLKFDFVKNDCLFSDFNFSKKKTVLSIYTGMSARTSDSPDF